jgi:hypothetical protein
MRTKMNQQRGHRVRALNDAVLCNLLLRRLPLWALLKLRHGWRFFRDNVSFEFVRARLHLPLEQGRTCEETVKRHAYLAFLELPSMRWLLENVTFHRFSQALKHVVQGSVRSASYRGTPALGVLLGHVQPSQAWGVQDHKLMFEFVNGTMTRAYCDCVTG